MVCKLFQHLMPKILLLTVHSLFDELDGEMDSKLDSELDDKLEVDELNGRLDMLCIDLAECTSLASLPKYYNPTFSWCAPLLHGMRTPLK